MSDESASESEPVVEELTEVGIVEGRTVRGGDLSTLGEQIREGIDSDSGDETAQNAAHAALNELEAQLPGDTAATISDTIEVEVLRNDGSAIEIIETAVGREFLGHPDIAETTETYASAGDEDDAPEDEEPEEPEE